ncbi:flavohemoglobin expression-modulating QEGLA motif protein [Pararhizobium sp. BT-229]|uniref:flavohemoglobin expression-modulating QEGLA motif protein n=1 Tax=Pararhizobium sp. BT-229 TaxID=2986923 RepID=UPI0021F7A6A0|nr:flavohemoglobin expression-modulating QEGLA motif protein [Pararhizobium sp. BT-229]MCV9967100.1 flavohemoglobin expression-modulating QEGLA motif protein [Pararhizobium sp. BT-229]
MTRTRRKERDALHPEWMEEILDCLRTDKPVRKDFDHGGRLHIDRPLPFLSVFLVRGRDDLAARDVAAANASYLIANDIGEALPIITAVGGLLKERFGAFMLLDIDELDHDTLLTDDAPYLPPFEISIAATGEPAAEEAETALADGVDIRQVKFRTPRVERFSLDTDFQAATLAKETGFPLVAIRFAPIYKQPESGMVYPDLRERLVANIFDAGLKAFAAFVAATQSLKLTSHRALGRKAFVDAVSRADRSIDEVAGSFDFLLAVTPINADAAWQEFRENKFKRTPQFLYRPLSVQVEAEKRKLFSVAFDRFEDPVLYHLYREKQQELDLQLSLISARETSRFVEYSRALYGPVETSLYRAATEILVQTENHRGDDGDSGTEIAGCYDVEIAARTMIASYRRQYEGFTAEIELRDDLPPGLLVSDDRLLISRATRVPRSRVHALLSHEIGVHLLTYFNGSAQGLRLFRSGLAGYEGMQEGLAVFSEHMAGGMTVGRLRLVAARVVACSWMLEGRPFAETYNMLVSEHGFGPAAAFNLALRLYRGGGLAKDAIYLRGLLELLDHLKSGGALDPFWMGKISSSHFRVMQELNLRGLLKAPVIRPAFLLHPHAQARLDQARAGMTPLDMITS